MAHDSDGTGYVRRIRVNHVKGDVSKARPGGRFKDTVDTELAAEALPA
jgi:hypothetical protein